MTATRLALALTLAMLAGCGHPSTPIAAAGAAQPAAQGLFGDAGRKAIIAALTLKAKWQLEYLDANDDEVLQREEVPSPMSLAFGAIDANHNNLLDLPEITRYMTGKTIVDNIVAEIVDAMARQDKDHDRRLSTDEFQGVLADPGPYTHALTTLDFVTGDLNGDRRLDLAEFEAICAKTAIVPSDQGKT